MDAKVNKSETRTFVINKEHIKNIWELLQSRIGSTTITIVCADDIEREYDTWKKFTLFDNSKSKQIKELAIHAQSEDYAKQASINFSSSISSQVYMRIKASEQVVVRLNSDIKDILDNTNPWYAKFVKIDFFYIIMFAFGVGIMNFYISHPEVNTNNKSEGNDALAILILLFIISAVIVVSLLLNKLRSRYFPTSVFAIGKGMDRYQFDEKIRWTVIMGFIISVIASLFSSVLL